LQCEKYSAIWRSLQVDEGPTLLRWIRSYLHPDLQSQVLPQLSPSMALDWLLEHVPFFIAMVTSVSPKMGYRISTSMDVDGEAGGIMYGFGAMDEDQRHAFLDVVSAAKYHIQVFPSKKIYLRIRRSIAMKLVVLWIQTVCAADKTVLLCFKTTDLDTLKRVCTKRWRLLGGDLYENVETHAHSKLVVDEGELDDGTLQMQTTDAETTDLMTIAWSRQTSFIHLEKQQMSGFTAEQSTWDISYYQVICEFAYWSSYAKLECGEELLPKPLLGIVVSYLYDPALERLPKKQLVQ
jgi:hypothetical protein